jgi:hypothetical protein
MEVTKWVKPSVSGSRYTVTPISRPVVKGTSNFLAVPTANASRAVRSFQRQRSPSQIGSLTVPI